MKKDSYTFKNEGNYGQYEHLGKVLESFGQVQACITSNKFEKAAEKIEQSITLVKNRMKLIKLPDRRELGWKTATEYEQNDLASASEDESVYRNLNLQRKEGRK